MPAPYVLSRGLTRIFRREVLDVVQNDPRTDFDNDLLYGYHRDAVPEQVLRRGLTDFSCGYVDARYGRLTPDEKVLLYCYFNQRKHIFACSDTYKAYSAALQEAFLHAKPPIIMDVGCGPATALLALSEVWPNRNLRYIGIDCAPRMLAMADRFWTACTDSMLLTDGSQKRLFESWSDIQPDLIKPDHPVIVAFSYLFANPSLHPDVLDSLACFIRKLADTRTHWPLHVLYVNSPHNFANDKYMYFKQLLKLGTHHPAPTLASIQYRTRSDKLIRTEKFVRELLVLSAKFEHDHAA